MSERGAEKVNWFQQLDLIHGPLLLIASIMAAGCGIFLLFRRSLRWWVFAIVSAIGALALSWTACWAAIHVFNWWAEDLPAVVMYTLALMLWAVVLGSTTALAGLRRRAGLGWRRRLAALMAAAVIVAFAGLELNAAFGQFPTVGSLLGVRPTVSTAPPPAPQTEPGQRFMRTGVAQGWRAPSGLPTAGTVLSATIPGKKSKFQARKAIVYLPPAYAAAQRPVFPVLVLVSGQPGSPESWLTSTQLIADLDSYAATHEGLAPIVVIPDPNGSDQANTMCMNSDVAQADTYMAEDVPQWITSHLDADTNPAHWAVGGFSYGGTCALQMVTRHPDIYRTFMAVSPEREPALSVKRSVTISRAFHGDTAAFDALLPLTLLAEKKFPEIHGWFAAGSSDATYSANVKVVQTAARQAGMTTVSTSFPGGHSWDVANSALKPGLSFVFRRLGLF